MKNIKHYLTESRLDNMSGYSKRDTMEDYYQALRDNHKRSTYVDGWIKIVQDLVSGKVKEVPRNAFRVKMGDPYGYAWIDSLVRNGDLLKIKKGRKEFILSPDSKQGTSIRKDIDTKTMMDEINRLERMYGNQHDIRFSYNEKTGDVDVSLTEFILTWFHYEKGHGEVQTDKEIETAKNGVVSTLTNSGIVKSITKEFAKTFGSSKFEITNKEELGKTTYGQDGHKGFDYKVSGKITK